MSSISTKEPAGKLPLCRAAVTWQRQLLLEARQGLRREAAPEQLVQSVWLLARLAYARVRGIGLASLLELRGEDVWQAFREELSRDPSAACRLMALDLDLDDDAKSAGDLEQIAIPEAVCRGLRRLAGRFERLIGRTGRIE